MCLFCFSGDPIEDDPKQYNQNQFETSMLKAPCLAPFTCISSCICCPCSAFYARKQVLQITALDPTSPNWINRYTCCQGYLDTPCLRAGYCCENKCPTFCLCIEACCCFGPSMSSSRAYIADVYEIRPDPCDNQLVRLSNCLNLMSCICDILALFDDSFRECRQILRLVAQCVFYTVFGCMSAQLFIELNVRTQQLPTTTCATNTAIVSTYDSITSSLSPSLLAPTKATTETTVGGKGNSKSQLQEDTKCYKPPATTPT